MTSRGSDETERGQTKWRSAGGLERLSLGFGFGRSKAWAGCDGPWAVIFILMGGFAVKIGYPILLVLDSSPRAFGGINLQGLRDDRTIGFVFSRIFSVGARECTHAV
jgi:hypothetical protein